MTTKVKKIALSIHLKKFYCMSPNTQLLNFSKIPR